MADNFFTPHWTTTAQKQETADLITFTEEILNGKLHFFVQCTSKNVFRASMIRPCQTKLFYVDS